MFDIPALTHCQTTNFRRFQTEWFYRQQFQIWRKWKKVIQTGRKHCGRSRNCLLRGISLFPTVFSKGLFPSGIKRCHCVGMGKPITRRQILDASKVKDFTDDDFKFDENGKLLSKHLLVTRNFSFSHSVFKMLVSQRRQKVSLCGYGLKHLNHFQNVHFIQIFASNNKI